MTESNKIPMTAGRTPNGAGDRKQAAEIFMSTIQNLYEKDYGDFMRKVVLYLERLRVAIGPNAGEAAKIWARMKYYTNFAPDFDIEATRLRLLRDADEIRRLVG